MPSSRHRVRFGEEPMAHSYINISRVRRQKPWIHAQSTSKIAMLAPKNGPVQKSTNEGDDDDFDYGALIDRADQRDQLPPNKFINHNTIMGERIMVSNRSIMHGKVTGNIMAGDTHKTCGTPIWQPQLAVATSIQKEQSQETDGHNWHYWPNIMTHTPPLRKATWHFLLQLWIRHFSEQVNVLENLSTPVHCPGLIAREIVTRMPTWTITQYLHQNIKLEGTPSVTTCAGNIVSQSAKRRQEHQTPNNWKRLEDQAPGDRLLQKLFLQSIERDMSKMW